MDQAKAQGQPINSTAQDGTYAAGVHRVTELLPVLMNDIISSSPEDQKVRKNKQDAFLKRPAHSSVYKNMSPSFGEVLAALQSRWASPSLLKTEDSFFFWSRQNIYLYTRVSLNRRLPASI